MNKPAHLQFSIIVPVFNRPDEIQELLDSLCRQTYTNFEVIIVEDGSRVLSEKICRDFMGRLDLKYHYKENSGPGLSRNYGMKKANGNYFIILDSDVIVPENYMKIIYNTLQNSYVDAFGGPDAAHQSFTPTQKAINYAMTSILTTGGIRGKSEKVEKFHPRSFNMGISKVVFNQTKGFSKLRFGEDIDLSIRIMEKGFSTKLIPEAFVYHKRRNTFASFYKQVFNSGIARINLYTLHKKSLKPAHFFPAVFTLGLLLGILLLMLGYKYWLLPYVLYAIVVFLDAFRKEKNAGLAGLSVLSSFVMLIGYGLGFMLSFWKRIILRKPVFEAFSQNFYK